MIDFSSLGGEIGDSKRNIDVKDKLDFVSLHLFYFHNQDKHVMNLSRGSRHIWEACDLPDLHYYVLPGSPPVCCKASMGGAQDDSARVSYVMTKQPMYLGFL